MELGLGGARRTARGCRGSGFDLVGSAGWRTAVRASAAGGETAAIETLRAASLSVSLPILQSTTHAHWTVLVPPAAADESVQNGSGAFHISPPIHLGLELKLETQQGK
jgi:hypothetical protein